MDDSHNYTWLHIGLGAFHRSHQAWYLHKLIEAGDTTWSITAGNMRCNDEAIATSLREQKGEYILETISRILFTIVSLTFAGQCDRSLRNVKVFHSPYRDTFCLCS